MTPPVVLPHRQSRIICYVLLWSCRINYVRTDSVPGLGDLREVVVYLPLNFEVCPIYAAHFDLYPVREVMGLSYQRWLAPNVGAVFPRILCEF